MSKRKLRAYSHGRRANRVYICRECLCNHPDNVGACRRCHSMQISHFASTAEGVRYMELCRLQQAGEISDLELQKRFNLLAYNNGVSHSIGHIALDFVYQERGKTVYEDVKGRGCPITDISDWKIRHLEAQMGIKVDIVRR